MGDAFRCWGWGRRQALWEVLAYGSRELLREVTQPDASQAAFGFAEPRGLEAFKEDYEAYRLSIRGHPMEAFRAKLKAVSRGKIRSIQEVRSQSMGDLIQVAGITIVRQRPPTAKGVVFATLEDETGLLDLIFHGPVYEKYRSTLKGHGLILIQGVLQKEREAVSVLVKRVSPLLPPQEQPTMRPKHEYFR